MKAFILASSAPSLRNFRGQLILDLKNAGYEVIACAPELDKDKNTTEWLVRNHIKGLNAPFSRTSLSPMYDILALVKLTRLIKRENPNVFLGYTVKPIVWGGIASVLSKVPNRVALITGLGFAFTGDVSGKRKIVRFFVKGLYKLSLRFMHHVFFQNPDDEQYFRDIGLMGELSNVHIVNGSGVSTKRFQDTPLPSMPLKFLLTARLLGDKGVREYKLASENVLSKFPNVEFHIVGGLDTNPNSILEREIQSWVEEKVVIWHGSVGDVRPFIENSHVFVLPSYREGTPRSVLEAMSMGRPIITTDAPGCRETVNDGENGFLVDVKSVEQLVEAMERFIKQPELIESMGKRSREIACEKYDVHKVNKVMLKAMGIIKE